MDVIEDNIRNVGLLQEVFITRRRHYFEVIVKSFQRSGDTSSGERVLINHSDRDHSALRRRFTSRLLGFVLCRADQRLIGGVPVTQGGRSSRNPRVGYLIDKSSRSFLS